MNLTPEVFCTIAIVILFFAYKIFKWFKRQNVKEAIYDYEPLPELLVPENPIPKDIHLVNYGEDELVDLDKMIDVLIENPDYFENNPISPSPLCPTASLPPSLLDVVDVQHKKYENLKLSDLSSMPMIFESYPIAVLIPHELVGIIRRHFNLFTDGEGYEKIISYDDYRDFLSKYDITIHKDLTKDPAFPTDKKTYESGLPSDFYKSEYDPTLSVDMESSRNSTAVKYTDGKNRIIERELNNNVLYKSYMKQFWGILKDGIYPTRVAFEYWLDEATKTDLGDETVFTVKESGEAIKDYVKGNRDYYDKLYKKLYEDDDIVFGKK